MNDGEISGDGCGRIYLICIARALLARGEHVRGLDNFSTGGRENIADILSSMEFREADLLDRQAVAAACEDVDYVLHQAAVVSVPKSITDPLHCNQINVDGTINLVAGKRRR